VISTTTDVLARRLVVDLNNSTERFSHVSQTLKLQPGRYVGKFKTEVRAIKSDGGLKWMISCLESRETAGESKAIVETGPDLTMTFDVVVPQQGCADQRLQLVTAGATTLDAKITTRMTFDDFEIVAASGQ
jgi:hypothetical protein